MKIILTHEVHGLGSAGDVVDVKDGYARNFLLPRSLATPWTKGGQKQVEAITKAREVRAVKSLDDAKALKGSLESAKVNLAARAGDTGRLFGAVTTADIADAVKAAGAGDVDRRTIQVAKPIRALGEHEVQVRLHPEVAAVLKLNVVAAK
ncbi:50S ribosomal protein L9 [Yimella sp. cx-51]|uniref:50S ribosomal protein L9 n=1 Tax=Yimella sp. cx-51 TaxID=2770551 RepID=UPI00165EA7D3|nr:50S ribosomal protein L9 [Yimella sp. cx-51]MBC9957838.1 50S ribosomal protein L9 [Yimella sp. cx-51]MBD2759551.1 50S ribosomal protein L9 [Yimella sp. cx-573]QTH37977.1 50S ribosomal protein L9 [Yimella sp. cx-51]